VAGGQKHEVAYEAGKTGASPSEVTASTPAVAIELSPSARQRPRKFMMSPAWRRFTIGRRHI